MEQSGISKKEYLKKYLSGGEKKKKKKKKTTQSLIIKSKIVDDDIDLNKMRPVNEDELEIFDLAEEAPQIVGVIDERPEEIRIMSEYKNTKKWKIVADEYGIENVKITAIDRRKSEDGSPKREQEISIEIKKSSEKKLSDSDKEESLKKKIDDPLKKVIKVEVDSDSSPPRKTKKEEPLKKVIKKEKHITSPNTRDDNSDASPPRRSRRKDDSDSSPPKRKKRNNSDSDASPPRRRHRNDSNEFSHKQKRKYDSDESPPRKSRKNDSDESPPRRRRKNDSDESPPRKRHSNNSSEYSSRKRDNYSRSHRKDSNGKKNSFTERNRNSMSPVSQNSTSASKKRDGYGLKLNNDHKNGSKKEKKASQLEKTLSGKKAGLQSAKDMRKEGVTLKQKEKEIFEQMPDEVSGKHAEAIVRNRKTGRRYDAKEEVRRKREKEEKEAEKIARYAVWGKGVKQIQDKKEKLNDDLYEMSKPLARYKDDKDLDEMLKNQEREGDPMLEYIRSKKKKKSKSSRPEYEGIFLPNRYDIKPGHKWDGVDRSNGYEKRWFEEQNAKKAREEEAFKWSTADM